MYVVNLFGFKGCVKFAFLVVLRGKDVKIIGHFANFCLIDSCAWL